MTDAEKIPEAAAEPVAWRVRVASEDHEEWSLLPAGGGADYLDRKGYECQPLYTAPPIPAVDAVPVSHIANSILGMVTEWYREYGGAHLDARLIERRLHRFLPRGHAVAALTAERDRAQQACEQIGDALDAEKMRNAQLFVEVERLKEALNPLAFHPAHNGTAMGRRAREALAEISTIAEISPEIGAAGAPHERALKLGEAS